MAKVTISEAVGLTGVSESTIRRDIKSGKVSSEKDEKGHRRIDIAELQRVYDLIPPPDSQKAETESQQIVGLLENQIADLRSQLSQASERENALITEKTKLLDMLSTEQEKTRLEQEKSRLLMLPASETNTAPERKPNWVQRLLGIQTS